METRILFDSLIKTVSDLGAYKASVIPTSDVETDTSFRALCEKNSCGIYVKNWACPPDAGDIEKLIGDLYSFGYMLVYQSVGKLEDSFDLDGMAEAAEKHACLTGAVREKLVPFGFSRTLFLGAGGCRVCRVCAKMTDECCRHPDKATPSLEAYGVNVAKLAPAAGMKYINGQNTVTYFGAVLFDL